MIGLARQKGEKAAVGPRWAACGCSLLIAFSISTGSGAQQPTRARQRATVRQDPAQQPAPAPQQQPPSAQTPPPEQQTPPAQQPTTPPQTAPVTPPAAKTPPGKEQRLNLRERAWLT